LFLGIHAIGETILSKAYPSYKSYNTVKFLGEATFDNVHMQKIELTDDEIKTISDREQWNSNTIFLADFEGNLQAGNYPSLSLPITGYRIKRKKVGELVYKTLGEVSSGSLTTYQDMSARNKQEYEYAIYPLNGDTEGVSIIGVSSLDFYGWFLSDLDNTKIFKFDMEIETDNIEVILDMKTYENYSEKPVIGFGKRNYIKGSLKTMPYSLNGEEISFNLSLLEDLKSFINNKEEKILRNSKGEVWKVITSNFSYKYMDKISGQPFIVSFDFIEVGSVD